jgi:poly-beta-1,6-N-acetyl-D-glucosamine synthase
MTDSSHELVACDSEKTEKNSNAKFIPPRYVVIMPARDEEEYIGAALESLVRQVCVASVILVVNDGSTDSTANIVREYSQQYPFVKLTNRPNRGKRHPGPGVVDAFYHGLRSLDDCSYDFIAKLDADCEYPPDFFLKLLQEFQNKPKLGICGGVLCFQRREGLEKDNRPTHHIRGASKVYRKSCFVDIGGIERALGWDVLDEFTARFKGWEAYTLESVHFVTGRAAGAPIGLWRKWMHAGRIAYMQQHDFSYVIVRSIWHLGNKPYLLAGLFILAGYFVGWWEKLPRIENRELIQFLRHEQREYLWKRLTLKTK